MAAARTASHHAPANAQEEEELLRLAIEASLAEASSGGAPSASRPAARPAAPPQQQPPQPQRPPAPPPQQHPSAAYWGAPGQPPQQQQQHAGYAYPPAGYPPVYPSPYPQQAYAPPAYPYGAYPPPAPSAPPAQVPQAGGSGRQAATPPPAPRPAAQPPASTSGGSGSQRPPAGTGGAAAAGAGAPRRRMHPDPSKCAGCGSGVWSSKLNALGRQWHPACFVCGFCSGPINEGGNVRFAIGQEDNWPYHMDCYKMAFNPVCSVCDAFVPPQPDGRVEFKEQVFWKARYCPSHQHDGTPQCCSCSRFQPRGTEFPQLADGRFLCLVCLGTVVVDTRDAQPLYDEVLRFFSNMGLPHPARAPFMLVDAFTLNEYSDKEGKDIKSGGPVFHVRGLTLATVYRSLSIPTIVRAAGGAGGLGTSSIATALGPSSVTCSVSAVLVMFGLPRLLTGSIIAHELMHAWLRMKNIAGLDQKVEEGLCQLLAYLWVEHQANCLTDAQEQRLASYFAYQIREDTSVVYGDGFREAFEAYQQRGLGAVVNDVLRRGRYT